MGGDDLARVAPRYSNPLMQRAYAAFLALARDPASDLTFRDHNGIVRRRTGAMHRIAFWRGFDGFKVCGSVLPFDRGSQAHAIYMAGREIAKDPPPHFAEIVPQERNW